MNPRALLERWLCKSHTVLERNFGRLWKGNCPPNWQLQYCSHSKKNVPKGAPRLCWPMNRGKHSVLLAETLGGRHKDLDPGRRGVYRYPKVREKCCYWVTGWGIRVEATARFQKAYLLKTMQFKSEWSGEWGLWGWGNPFPSHWPSTE